MCQSKVRCLFVFASRCHPDRAQRRGTSLRFPPSSKSDYLQPKSVFLSSIFLQRTHTKCNPIPQRSRRLSLSSRQSAATRDLSSFPAIIQKRLPATEICLSLLHFSAANPHQMQSHTPTEPSPLVVIPTERSDEGPLSVSRHHPKAITCNRNLSFSPLSFCTAPTESNPAAQRSRRLSLSSRQSAATRDLSSFPAIISKRLLTNEICLSLL